MTPPITRRQQEVLAFIVSFCKDHNYSPTVREIMRAMGFKSTNTVRQHLAGLEQRGAIKRLRYAKSGIQVINSFAQ